MRKRAFTAFTAAVIAVTLAGCGAAEEGDAGSSGHAGGPPGGPAAPAGQAGHNQADVAFVRGMNPHHGQAVEMAQAARSRAQSPQVKELAGRIEAAQGPEIATMQGWLTRWGAAAPHSGMEGMDHAGGAGMGQMMSAEEMDRLSTASGAEFDRMFLEMMIQHHQGAVEMARTEVATGKNADAVRLARHIIDSQQAEIGQMRALLTQL